ncbi:unnamed protein product [Adineta steineri]|uniref:Uncharacterized protein n=1 Tax=Adineta steineri TaxID=433720 RepID=A0A819DWW4_9BILA|nr:unnamed protein product [Adineta steineri]CAF3840443.1 unnamed protein product [Adineta steineri]
MNNHFITPNADDCASTILFKPALPQTILKPDYSASSFLTLAPYGTGKTLLRCEYYKSIRSDTYFKVLILNKEIDEYLQRFVDAKAMSGTNCDKEGCIMKWSSDEFGQLLLSLLVTQFVETFEKESLDLTNISLDEKIELITIMCYYYNEQGVSKLEKFVNSFLDKTGNSMYRASAAVGLIKLNNNVYTSTPLFSHLRNDLRKLSALRQDEEKMLLLIAIAEGEYFQIKALEATLSNNVLNDLRRFALFMKKHVKKTAVFIIDGVNENRFFFNENNINRKSLELFCRSSLSQEIVAMVVAHNFYLSIFYPKIDDISMEDGIIRKDKFPILEINWNIKSLINYADYVLQETNKYASASRCRSFTDFTTLVNYSNPKNAEIINQISTPRVLHYFMQHLIEEMNYYANDVKEPFIATTENIYTAYETAAKSTFKVHFINK